MQWGVGIIGLFLTSVLLSIALFPGCIRLLKYWQVGQYIQDDVSNHSQKSNTPTCGGVFIVIMVNLLAGLWGGLNTIEVLWVDFMLIGYMLIGLTDDLSKLLHKDNNLGLTPRVKLLLQMILAGVALVGANQVLEVSLTSIAIPVGGGAFWNLEMGWLYYPFALFVIVGATNAFNLTDGLDGLASGLTIMVCLGLLVIILNGQVVQLDNVALNDIVVILVALIGVMTGFLWFNCNPASIFLGDSGSLCLGAGLVYIAILLKMELVFGLMAGVFIIETASVICQVLYFKRTGGKRIFKMAPLHHHYELSGLKEPKIVVRFWILGLIFLMISICLVI